MVNNDFQYRIPSINIAASDIKSHIVMCLCSLLLLFDTDVWCIFCIMF